MSKNSNKKADTLKKETYISVRQKPWKDLEDNDFIYKQGDIFPREGLKVSPERIKELSTTKNKIGEILIKKVDTKENENKDNEEAKTENEDNGLSESEKDNEEVKE